MDGHALTDWQTFPLPLDSLDGLRFSAKMLPAPAFRRGKFTVTKPGDTFLDLRGWGKGVVWVNGHNLGRFWDIGPQQTLYLPAPWLRKGKNEIHVLVLKETPQTTLAGLAEPILDQRAPV